MLLSTERRLSRITHPEIASGLCEFLVFGVKQAAACVFAGSFLFLLAISSHISIFGLARYDFLFLSAIAIQIVLVVVRLENWREVAVLSLFHLIGMGLELFKTSPSIRSWSYPEHAFFHLRTVPALQRIYVRLGCQLHHAVLAANEIADYSLPVLSTRSGIMCRNLCQFFHQSLHRRSALASGSLRIAVILAHADPFRRD
jgi:uncharacterized membrane protein YoaT (DUF817 family)